MKYTLLSELYYKNQTEYENLYFSRFNGENTIQLSFKIYDNDAFLCLCPDIFNLQEGIMKTDKRISDVCTKLPDMALLQFTKRSLIDEIILTNNIEGVHSSRREIDDVLISIKEHGPKKRFFGLVNKYNLLSSDRISLKTCEDIRQIYDELVLNEIAQDNTNNVPDGKIFRKDIAEVTTSTGKIIHSGCFPEEKIIENMNCALRILNDTSIPIIVRISIFHYLFGYIHPFYDGNGRTSRFISSYLLAQNFEPLIGYRLSYTIKENINKYYRVFKICNDSKSRGDITPFVIGFMEIINESMENLYKALSKRLLDLQNFVNKMEAIPCFREKDIQEFCFVLIQAELFSEYGITKAELLDLFKISSATVDKKLQFVERQNYLKKQRVGRPYYYSFDVEKLL